MSVGGRTGLIRAILEGSSFVREEVEQSVAEARIEQARRCLRLGLNKTFPELVSLVEIDQIRDVDALLALFESLFEATNAGEVHEAILAAAKPN